MRDLLDRYFLAFPRNAADGTGGEGASAGAGDAAGDPPAGGDGGQPSGSGAAAAEPPAGPYFPEGLAENLRGTNDRETIDRLTGALKGYRDRDAGADRPDKPEGYLSLEGIDDKQFKVDERFKPYFDAFANDPGMKAAAAVAQKHGISRPAFLEGMQAALGGLAQANMLDPMVDFEAERAALLPEAARTLPKDQQDAAIDRRMNDNLAFVDLMVANRALPKEVGEYAALMLADSAKGHLFLEWMRNTVQGGGAGGPGAHGMGGAGADSADSLRAEMAKPELTPGHPSFDRGKYAEFDARYKAFHSRQAAT